MTERDHIPSALLLITGRESKKPVFIFLPDWVLFCAQPFLAEGLTEGLLCDPVSEHFHQKDLSRYLASIYVPAAGSSQKQSIMG